MAKITTGAAARASLAKQGLRVVPRGTANSRRIAFPGLGQFTVAGGSVDDVKRAGAFIVPARRPAIVAPAPRKTPLRAPATTRPTFRRVSSGTVQPVSRALPPAPRPKARTVSRPMIVAPVIRRAPTPAPAPVRAVVTSRGPTPGQGASVISTRPPGGALSNSKLAPETTRTDGGGGFVPLLFAAAVAFFFFS